MDDLDFFTNFTHSVAAVRVLLQKAHKEGSFIEGLVLYASIIDALLRNLVALESGVVKNGSRSLDPRYFYHDDSKWMNERYVYKEALNLEVITKEEFERLNSMYDFRNRVMHRFIISNISYVDIGLHLEEYERFFSKLYKKLEEIEQPEPQTRQEQRKTNQIIAKKLFNDES